MTGVLLVILAAHWLADFVWQPDWMARGKSSNWLILGEHAGRIFLVLTGAGLGIVVVFNNSVWTHPNPVTFATVNAVAHFAIDAITSRITARLWLAERRHAFFTVIGFDQLLHVSLYVVTAGWLVST